MLLVLMLLLMMVPLLLLVLLLAATAAFLLCTCLHLLARLHGVLRLLAPPGVSLLLLPILLPLGPHGGLELGKGIRQVPVLTLRLPLREAAPVAAVVAVLGVTLLAGAVAGAEIRVVLLDAWADHLRLELLDC